MATKSTTGNQGGRPRVLTVGDKQIHRQLRRLAAIFATQLEAASVLGCSISTLARFLVTDPDAGEAWEQGQAEARISLRRMQFRAAAKGNSTMLVWLGKQHLQQTDRTDTNVRFLKRIEDCSTEELEFLLEGHERMAADFEKQFGRSPPRDTDDTGRH